MPIFRRKPEVIKATQYVEYGKLVPGMCNSTTCYSQVCNEPHVHTIHDNQLVRLEIGDWVVPEADGEHFYLVKPDVMAKTYDRVPEMCPSCGQKE